MHPLGVLPVVYLSGTPSKAQGSCACAQQPCGCRKPGRGCPAGAGNSVAVVDLPRCAPMLSPRVDYIDHLNTHRPHRSLDQRPPVATDPPDQPDRHLQVVEAARCNGLINEYRNAA